MSTLIPTPEQQVAIDYHDSMVAIAKPGSGKTFVISEKIRAILPTFPNYRGVIAISYTNKASDELKSRITRNGINQKASFFGTIDKFCDGEIIIPFLTQLWGKPREEIKICKIRDLDEEEQELFSNIQSNQVSLEDLNEHLDILTSNFRNGQIFIETNGALSLYTLTHSPACQHYIKARYSHIFIDEYQDSGLEQHELFLKLKELGLIAIAVGDADQSIFGFSGKDSKYLLSIAKMDEFEHFAIDFNHRCHPSIINYSQRLLNKKASLLAADEYRVFKKTCAGNSAAIAQWIDRSLPQMIIGYGVERYSEVGVLVRSGISGALIDSTLQTKHRYFINHPLEEHFSLWARLFCQLLTYRFDHTITAQEIIETSTAILMATEVRSLRKLIMKVRSIEHKELTELLVNVASMLLPNARSEEAISLLVASVDDDLSLYFEPAKDNEVQVMTLHKAKGLEFDIVFHLDLYEWILPSKRPGPNNDFDKPEYPSWEQDVNLHYVGVTRAKKACFLCTSTTRVNASGEVRSGRPSEFFPYHNLHELREEAGV